MTTKKMDFTAVLTDIAVGEQIFVTGVLPLLLKLKGVLATHSPDLKLEIHKFDADAKAVYAQDLADVNQWLVDHGHKALE